MAGESDADGIVGTVARKAWAVEEPSPREVKTKLEVYCAA